MSEGFTLEDDINDDGDFGENDENGLTEEGQQMWKVISEQELPRAMARARSLPVNTLEKQLGFIQTQIKKMIQHSKNVIRDCDEIIETYRDEKQYLAGDAKVAKTLHSKLIVRLTRLLDSQEVFDFEVKIEEKVEDTRPIPLFYKPKR